MLVRGVHRVAVLRHSNPRRNTTLVGRGCGAGTKAGEDCNIDCLSHITINVPSLASLSISLHLPPLARSLSPSLPPSLSLPFLSCRSHGRPSAFCLSSPKADGAAVSVTLGDVMTRGDFMVFAGRDPPAEEDEEDDEEEEEDEASGTSGIIDAAASSTPTV
jgi:hypothetical protein